MARLGSVRRLPERRASPASSSTSSTRELRAALEISATAPGLDPAVARTRTGATVPQGASLDGTEGRCAGGRPANGPPVPEKPAPRAVQPSCRRSFSTGPGMAEAGPRTRARRGFGLAAGPRRQGRRGAAPGRRRARPARARSRARTIGMGHRPWPFAQSRTRPPTKWAKRARSPGAASGADFHRRILRAGSRKGEALFPQLLPPGPARARPGGEAVFAGLVGRPAPPPRRCDSQQPLTAPDGQARAWRLWLQKAGDGKLLHPIVTGGRGARLSPLLRGFSRAVFLLPARGRLRPGPWECRRAGSGPRHGRTSRNSLPLHVGEDLSGCSFEGKSGARFSAALADALAAVAEPGAALSRSCCSPPPGSSRSAFAGRSPARRGWMSKLGPRGRGGLPCSSPPSPGCRFADHRLAVLGWRRLGGCPGRCEVVNLRGVFRRLVVSGCRNITPIFMRISGLMKDDPRGRSGLC